MFTKRFFVAVGLIAVVITLVILYVNWPAFLSQIDSSEGVALVNVIYPSAIYKPQDLPITVNVANIGRAEKDVVIGVSSAANPTIFERTHLSGSSSTANLTVYLPVRSFGEQSFKTKIYWAGPGGLCNLEQDSADNIFTVLSADYSLLPLTNIASIAENFNWVLNITNRGNAPADHLIVKVNDKGPLIISSPDTQALNNFQVGETRQVSFRFSVPHDAEEGKTSISINLETCYPNCQETISQQFAVTLQKSPMQVEIENMTEKLYWMIPLAIAAMALFGIFGKKRR